MNAYPDKPVLPYKKTTVKMVDVIQYIASMNIPLELRRAAYIFFRIESANGESGINNNYIGAQADSGRWPGEYDSKIIGTVVKNENQTGRERRFIAFNSFKDCIDLLAGRLQARGLYVGGITHKIAKVEVKTPVDLARAYIIEWVTGDANAHPSTEQLNNFLSIYKQAERFFPG
jgi:hypothetical protein